MDEHSGDRRAFFSVLTGAMSGLIGLVLAVPGVGALLHPLFKETASLNADDSVLGVVDSFKVGAPRKVSIVAARRDGWLTSQDVTIGAVWILRTAQKPPKFTVLSAICPHRGCPVTKTQGGFLCPCHNSRFEVDGALQESKSDEDNPSPRNMDALEHDIRNGRLYCRYQKFKTGTAEKVPV